MDPSARLTLWESLAATEMRLELMSNLMGLKVGLADIEEFNLGLKSNLKNLNSDKTTEMQDQKIVKVTMEVKIRDERISKNKLMRQRNRARSEMQKTMGGNSKPYRREIKNLRDAARTVKEEYRKLHSEKLEHLKDKYRKTQEEKTDSIPEEMQEYIELSVFDREKYDRLQEDALEFEQELAYAKVRMELQKEISEKLF